MQAYGPQRRKFPSRGAFPVQPYSSRHSLSKSLAKAENAQFTNGTRKSIILPRPATGQILQVPVHAMSNIDRLKDLAAAKSKAGMQKFHQQLRENAQLSTSSVGSGFLPSDGLTPEQEQIESRAIKFQRKVLRMKASQLPAHLSAIGESIPADCKNIYIHYRREWQAQISPSLKYRENISKLADPLYAGDELSSAEMEARQYRLDNNWFFRPGIDPISTAVARKFTVEYAKHKRQVMHQFAAWMHLEQNRENSSIKPIKVPFYIHNVYEFAMTRLFLDYSDVQHTYTLVSQILLYDRLLYEDLQHPRGMQVEHELYIRQLRHMIKKEGELHKAKPIFITDLLRLIVDPDLMDAYKYSDPLRVAQEDFSAAVFGVMVGQRAATLLAIQPADVSAHGDHLQVKLWSAKVFNKRGTRFIAGCGCIEALRAQLDVWIQFSLQGIGYNSNAVMQLDRSTAQGKLLLSDIFASWDQNGTKLCPVVNRSNVAADPTQVGGEVYALRGAKAIVSAGAANPIAQKYGKGTSIIPRLPHDDLRPLTVDSDNLDHDINRQAQKRVAASTLVAKQRRKSEVARQMKQTINTVYPISSVTRRQPEKFAQYIRCPAFCPIHGNITQKTITDILPLERNLDRLIARLKCTRHSFRRSMVLWAVLAEHANVVSVDWDSLAKQLQWSVPPGTNAKDGMIKYYTADWRDFLPVAHLLVPAPACSAILRSTNNFSALAEMAAAAADNKPALVKKIEESQKRKAQMPQAMANFLAGGKWDEDSDSEDEPEFRSFQAHRSN